MNVWVSVVDRHILFICGDIIHHQSLDQYLRKLVSLSGSDQQIICEIVLPEHFLNVDEELSGVEEHVVVDTYVGDFLDESTETNTSVDRTVFDFGHLSGQVSF